MCKKAKKNFWKRICHARHTETSLFKSKQSSKLSRLYGQVEQSLQFELIIDGQTNPKRFFFQKLNCDVDFGLETRK